jgi:hypothetical protein
MEKFAANVKQRDKFLTGCAQFIWNVTADIKKSVFSQNVFENAITVN